MHMPVRVVAVACARHGSDRRSGRRRSNSSPMGEGPPPLVSAGIRLGGRREHGGYGDEDFPVRNVWSGSMMVEREAFQTVNGFREELSKIRASAQPEDTELCLRLSHVYNTKGQWLMVPSALAEHYVPAHRTTLRYVVHRCWSEGAGKVRMRAMVADRSRALADEKTYLSKTIPRAVRTGMLESLLSRSSDGLMRSGTILLGVGAAILGAITAGIGAAFTRQERGESP